MFGGWRRPRTDQAQGCLGPNPAGWRFSGGKARYELT